MIILDEAIKRVAFEKKISKTRKKYVELRMLTGYMHPGYSESLKEFGTPQKLPCSGGYILKRQVPGFPDHDAMGCYPIFACPDWSLIHVDLEALKNELVCISLVTDPFSDTKPDYLRKCFDSVKTFKEHFIADLSQSPNDFVSKHHRYYGRKAMKKLNVEVCSEPIKYLDEWIDLYSVLAERHNIRGIKAFSRKAFSKQLSLPGLTMFRANLEGVTVGLNLWFVQGEVAYDHLSAYSSEGYALRVSYALKWYAIQYFSERLRWADLGGRAGIGKEGEDGLDKFKMGWSTGTLPVYFCSHVFDQEKYDEIVKKKDIKDHSYFPAYRRGEFS